MDFQTMHNKLIAIKEEITTYHHALDTRQHRGVAQDKCICAIEYILEMPWVRGATLSENPQQASRPDTEKVAESR